MKKNRFRMKNLLYIQKKKNLAMIMKTTELHSKVKDHCHYTGKYRGVTQNICNLKYRTLKQIPVVFHNGSKYDYHFIIRELAEDFERQFEYLEKKHKKIYNFFRNQ